MVTIRNHLTWKEYLFIIFLFVFLVFFATKFLGTEIRMISKPAVVGGLVADGGGGRCFIAASADGISQSDKVIVLRNSKDELLAQDGYNKFIPTAAGFTAGNESLKPFTRAALIPVIYSVKYPYAFMVLILISGIVVIWKAISWQ